MRPTRMLAMSLPILIIVGGLFLGKKEVYSSSGPSPNPSHTLALETGESNPVLLLAKKERLAAAPQGLIPPEELEIEKSRPKGTPPVNIPTTGYYTFNFRTYGYRMPFVLGDNSTGEEIESWPYVSGSPYGTHEQPTILELDQGYHYFKFYSTGSNSGTRLLEVTANSF